MPKCRMCSGGIPIGSQAYETTSPRRRPFWASGAAAGHAHILSVGPARGWCRSRQRPSKGFVAALPASAGGPGPPGARGSAPAPQALTPPPPPPAAPGTGRGKAEELHGGIPGVSLRSRSQRQSGANGTSTDTGRPMAPARCTTDVSTATSLSRTTRIAMVSGEVGDLRSKMDQRRGHRNSPPPAPPPADLQRHQSGALQRRQRRQGLQRGGAVMVIAVVGPPGPDDADRLEAAGISCASRARTARHPGGIGAHIWHRAGMVSRSVPNSRGRPESGNRRRSPAPAPSGRHSG